MTNPSGRHMQVSQKVRAPREAVYRAFLEPDALASWLAPDTMRGQVEVFEPRDGGRIRMTLTYLDAADAQAGKTSDAADTFEGRFVQLIPNEKIVWLTEFDTEQPDMAGEMKMTWTFTDVNSETEVTVLFEDIPPGIRLEDNETGTRQTLRKLAQYVERGKG